MDLNRSGIKYLNSAVALLAMILPAAHGDAAPVSYARQIAPIMKEKCNGCHYPGKLKAKLDLTSVGHMLKGGETGPAVIAGKADTSLLYEQIAGDNPEMPPKGKPLTTAQVALIKQWIKEGAKDDSPKAGPAKRAAPEVYHVAPPTTAIAYSPDGKVLAVAGYHEVVLHDATPQAASTTKEQPGADGKPASRIVARLAGDSPRIESIAFSKDGKWLGVAGGAPSRFGEVQVWRMSDRKLFKKYRVANDSLYGFCFSPDARQLAVGCADKTARVLRVDDGEELFRFSNHADWVLGTCFTHDGKRLVTAGRDKAMKIVDMATKRFVDDINNPLEAILCFARHPKDNVVAYGGQLGTTFLYKISDNQKRTAGRRDTNLMRKFERQPGAVHAIAFSPDAALIAIGSTGPAVHLYQTKDGKKVASLSGHQGPVFSIAFHSNSKTLTVGGYDGKLRTYDAKTGKLLRSFDPVPVDSNQSLSKR